MPELREERVESCSPSWLEAFMLVILFTAGYRETLQGPMEFHQTSRSEFSFGHEHYNSYFIFKCEFFKCFNAGNKYL